MSATPIINVVAGGVECGQAIVAHPLVPRITLIGSVATGRAIASAQVTLDGVLAKARFWQRFADIPLNERQVKLLNRLLDGFEGKLTSSKWAAIGKCSPDTALRDITQLVTLGVLRKSAGGGRSTGYELVHGEGSEATDK